MDDRGRLHMPGFVGKTFEETGVSEEKVRDKVRLAEVRNAAKDGMNRKARRKLMAELNHDRKAKI